MIPLRLLNEVEQMLCHKTHLAQIGVLLGLRHAGMFRVLNLWVLVANISGSLCCTVNVLQKLFCHTAANATEK